MNGMSAAATEMQKYQSFWDKYKPLWEMDVDAIIRNRKYAKSKRSLQQYVVWALIVVSRLVTEPNQCSSLSAHPCPAPVSLFLH
jgi:hypothetical protein